MKRRRRGRRSVGGREDLTRPRTASGPGASVGASDDGAPDASNLGRPLAGVWVVTVDAHEARLEYETPGQPRRRCGRGDAKVFADLRAFVCNSAQPGDLVVIEGRVFYRPVAAVGLGAS